MQFNTETLQLKQFVMFDEFEQFVTFDEFKQSEQFKQFEQFEQLLCLVVQGLSIDELSWVFRKMLFEDYLSEFSEEERAHLKEGCFNRYTCKNAHLFATTDSSEKTFENWLYKACPNLLPVSGTRTDWTRVKDWTDPVHYEPDAPLPDQVQCSEEKPCTGNCDFHLFVSAVRRIVGEPYIPMEDLYCRLPASSQSFEYSIVRNNVRPYEFRGWVLLQALLIQEEYEKNQGDVFFSIS